MLLKDKNSEVSNRHRLEETTDFIFIRDKGPSDLGIENHKQKSISPLNILQFSEKEVLGILDALPDLVLKIQGNGNIVYCNFHNNNFNLTRDEILDKNISEVFHPLTHLQFVEAIENLQKCKLTQIFEFQQFENSELHEYEARLNKISSENEYVAIIRDISEQKRNELILKKDEKKHRTLFDSTAYSMLVLNNQGKIELANSTCEKMFGYKRDELTGKIIEVLIPDKYVHNHHENIKKFFYAADNQNVKNIMQTYGQAKNGTMFPIEIRLTPAEFYDGSYVIASIIDLVHPNKRDSEADFKQL